MKRKGGSVTSISPLDFAMMAFKAEELAKRVDTEFTRTVFQITPLMGKIDWKKPISPSARACWEVSR